ncbi:hypothetical protein FQN60_010572 [Etheostoma spectabile]|uniref:Uncharacterized protein n=1 Tax=Etheostoma spectabile TaxID=54343 RepID=A0A5J5CC60_9PERO|nr:hypothetical protein FQN60_010572 [Etheostoma spectabile]
MCYRQGGEAASRGRRLISPVSLHSCPCEA